jgi:predicted aspartyl protease
MPSWPGFYKGKKPCIQFLVTGTQGHPEEVVATLDTGFDGFLLMSKAQAAPHALEPVGTTMATLANGVRYPVETAFANVGFAMRTTRGVAALIDTPGECLVGIDFLRKFNLALILTESRVLLMTATELDRLPGLGTS